MSMEKEKHVSLASESTILISKVIYSSIHLLIPLIVGKLFGIVAERIAFGLIIFFITIRFMDALLVMDTISVGLEKALEECEKAESEKNETN